MAFHRRSHGFIQIKVHLGRSMSSRAGGPCKLPTGSVMEGDGGLYSDAGPESHSPKTHLDSACNTSNDQSATGTSGNHVVKHVPNAEFRWLCALCSLPPSAHVDIDIDIHLGPHHVLKRGISTLLLSS